MRLGVSFIGFDIDQGYLDEAISRVMKEGELKELSCVRSRNCPDSINPNNNYVLSQSTSQRNKKLTDYICR